MIHFKWICSWSLCNNPWKDQYSSPLNIVQLIWTYLHCCNEVTNEDIPSLNKFQERLHVFHWWQNINQPKQQVYVRQKAQVCLPQLEKLRKTQCIFDVTCKYERTRRKRSPLPPSWSYNTFASLQTMDDIMP
jgi:hypothetical protein